MSTHRLGYSPSQLELVRRWCLLIGGRRLSDEPGLVDISDGGKNVEFAPHALPVSRICRPTKETHPGGRSGIAERKE